MPENHRFLSREGHFHGGFGIAEPHTAGLGHHRINGLMAGLLHEKIHGILGARGNATSRHAYLDLYKGFYSIAVLPHFQPVLHLVLHLFQIGQRCDLIHIPYLLVSRFLYALILML